MRWLVTGIHRGWFIAGLHSHAVMVMIVMVVILRRGCVVSLHGHAVMMMVVTVLMSRMCSVMESGQDIARPQGLQLEGIVHWGLGLAVGGRLVMDVDIMLREMVIGVRDHVLGLRLPVHRLRLLVNWVWLLVCVGRGLIVVIRRWRPIARGGCSRV